VLTSDADLHRRAKEVVLAALELDLPQRERFVATACAGDERLCAEVWSLLAVEDPSDDFLERPPVPLVDVGDGQSGHRLSPGDVVAERFEIAGILGEGGMGVVYEAWDRELGQAVALKAIRPEHEGDAGRRERMRREMKLARRVTHPNVCRVYEVFHHRTEGCGEPLTLLAMELLRGESLAERLAARGRLSAGEALPLLSQIAAGLDAAHRADVIHRDFKTSNVMLVPDGAGGERAVITDFGVARAARPDEGGATTLTSSGEVVGTPAYMAPEQLLGRPATVASDLYAFGVVAYETLAGRKPFPGSTPFSAAARRLTEDPPRLGTLMPELDRRWQRAVERCLERDPEDRFRSAADFVLALAGQQVAGPRGVRARARRLAIAATVAAALVVSGTVFLVFRERGEAAPAAGAAAQRRSVAVLDLENGDGQPRWRALSAAERLDAELRAGGALATVPRDRVVRVLRDLGAGGGASESAPIDESLGRALGVDHLLTGTLAGDPAGAGRVVLELTLLDAENGGVTARITELGAVAKLPEVIARAADRVRAALDVEAPNAEERRAALASLPAGSAAEESYAEGLARLRAFDAAGAREQFERAIAAEPDWALGHFALAEAWEALGFEARAREAGRRAFELRAPLPRPDQLFVEARFRAWSFEWERAIELYRALFTVFPDRVDVGLRLVTAQVSAGEGDAALETVETLRALPPPQGEDPRIDLAEGEAAWAASDWDRHLRAARQARAKAEQLGLVALSAEAACEEGWSHRYRGALDDAAAAGERCLSLWKRSANPGGEADALNFLATVDLDRGELERAAQRYRESAELERRMGNLNGVAVASANLGNALYETGDLDQAASRYAEAQDLFGQVGRREGVGMMHNALGNVALGAARLAEARDRYRGALAVGRELGAKRLEALALNNLGNVALQTAALDEAQGAFEESLALCRELGHTRLEAYDLYGLGEVAFWRGELEAARAHHESALALREAAGEEVTAAESRLALARVALESGDAEAALEGARAATARFGDGGTRAAEAGARTVEARALLALGHAAGAREAARRAIELALEAGAPAAELDSRLALALAEAAGGSSEAARSGGRQVNEEAARLGLETLRHEASCLVAALDRRAGEPPGAASSPPPTAAAAGQVGGLLAVRCARLL
jgi:tetratricopeptide (TPR) repeat protein